MRQGEEIAAGPWQGAAAGEDGAEDTAVVPRGKAGRDSLVGLVERLRRAARTGRPLTLGAHARASVRRIGPEVFQVTREAGR